jgi:serine/threonine protein kinase
MALPQVINKEELCREENKMFLVEKEIEIMSQLDHPNIVKLYEVYVNDEEVEKRATAKMIISPLTIMLKTSILSFLYTVAKKIPGKKKM